MRDEIIEGYGVPDICADEVANVRIIRNEMLFHYWAWQMTPSGVLHRALVARFRMPLTGVMNSRPLIHAAIEVHRKNLPVNNMVDLATAH